MPRNQSVMKGWNIGQPQIFCMHELNYEYDCIDFCRGWKLKHKNPFLRWETATKLKN